MHKGIIAFIAIIAIVVIVWYISTGFKPPPHASSSTSITSKSTQTTTIPSNVVKNHTTPVYFPCSSFSLYNESDNAAVSGSCYWTGGTLGLWVAGGNTGLEHVVIKGPGNITVVNQTDTYGCITFYDNFSIPAGVYSVTLETGPGRGSCGFAIAKLNNTTVPPITVYNFVFNGDFHTGSYAGWNVTGKGFGVKPLNITYADSQACYIGQPWSGYNGTYFATTYNCGLSNAPGNLTSSPFYADESFLNFKTISPANNELYIEILYGGKPAVVAHYDTYNTSLGPNASSTFRNASIPLTTVIGESVQVRIVADTLLRQTYIAAGDFVLSARPEQQTGILTNMTFS